MAARRTKRLGLIHCPAEPAFVHAVAQSRGLTAEAAESPDQFYLLSSGRNLASEVEPALFAEAVAAFDQAVHNGAIPRWSLMSQYSRAARGNDTAH